MHGTEQKPGLLPLLLAFFLRGYIIE